MPGHYSEQHSSQKEAKSKASKTDSRGKILSAVAKAEKTATDAIFGQYFKDIVRVLAPKSVKHMETLGKIVSDVVGFDYNDWQKGKFTPREVDFTDPSWLKNIASHILASTTNEGGNKDGKE